jgi:hypothetical protein
MQSETGTRVQDPTDGKVSIVVTPPTLQEPDRHETN